MPACLYTDGARLPDMNFIRSLEKMNSGIDINPENVKFEHATVLIVDDVVDNRRYLKDALRLTDLTLLEAVNGISALEILENKKADLVVTDIRMPGMHGFELLARIKGNANLNHIPVIAYSTWAAQPVQGKTREYKKVIL